MEDISDFLKRAKKQIDKKKEVSESSIEEDFCDYARKYQCKPLKLVLVGLVGFPDRTVLCPGARVIFFEFKRKNKKLRPSQRAWKKSLKDLGFEFHTCDEKGLAEAHLKRFLRNDKK